MIGARGSPAASAALRSSIRRSTSCPQYPRDALLKLGGDDHEGLLDMSVTLVPSLRVTGINARTNEKSSDPGAA